MKKTFKIAALAFLASLALALAGCSNASGGGALLAAFGAGVGTQTASGGEQTGGGNGSGGDNNSGGGQNQQNTTETKWTISGTEYTVKDGKVTVTQNGTKTEVGTVDSSGVVTITQGGQTITVQAQGAGTSNVTVTIATTTTDANGATTTTTKTYSGDLTGGTLVNTEDSSDTITIAKVETTTGGGNTNPPAATYTITIAQGIEHGTVSADKTSAAQGDTVTLTATPQDGYQLGAWNVTDSDGAAVTVEGGAFVMPAKNVMVNATFTQLAPDTYSISVTGGTATFADQPVTSVSAGATITITANAPEAGKVFDRWTTTTEGVTFNNETNSTTTFVMPAKNVSITATYKWIDYTVTYADGVDSAVIAVPTDSTAYHMGDTVTVMFDGVGTRDNYTFAGWSDGTTTYTSAGTKTFTIGTANVTLTAQWNTAIAYTPYTFHDTPEVLPAGTDGTAGTSAKYVYFGDYPQDVLSKELEAQLTFDESRAITRGGLAYIPASDGNYYVHIQENAQWNEQNHAKYVDGSEVQKQAANSWRYFKVMPLKWLVLTNDYDVDGNYGNNTGSLLFLEHGVTVGEGAGGKTIPRYWLNGVKYSDTYNYESKGFIDAAFSSEGAAKIIDTKVDVNEEQLLFELYHTGSFNWKPYYFISKLFILSSKELTNSAYGFGDTVEGSNCYTRERFMSDYARACNGYIYQYKGYGCFYFTRSFTVTAKDNPNYSGGVQYTYYQDIVWPTKEIKYGVLPSGYNSLNLDSKQVNTCCPAICVKLDGTTCGWNPEKRLIGTTWQYDANNSITEIKFTTETGCTYTLYYNGGVIGSPINGTYSLSFNDDSYSHKYTKVSIQLPSLGDVEGIIDDVKARPYTLTINEAVFIKQ